jgi:hypothetical protein
MVRAQEPAAPAKAASPAPAASAAADNYWPMTLGSNWEMDIDVNGKSMKQVLTVTKATKTDTGSEATVQYKIAGSVVTTEVYRTDAKGVYRVAGGKDGTNSITPPFNFIQYPLVPGNKWSWKGKIFFNGKNFDASANVTSSGPDKLSLLAGEFQAIRVHVDLSVIDEQGNKFPLQNDYWFAPGVGIVQQKAILGDKVINGTLSSYELK